MERALKQCQNMVEQSKWGVDTTRQGKQIMNLASQIGNLKKWKTIVKSRKVKKHSTNLGIPVCTTAPDYILTTINTYKTIQKWIFVNKR
jgi:hypothetical protein